MALFGKKKEREPEHCCCCGRELKPTGAGAFLLKMVAAQKTGKDFQNMKQEYLLDPYGKGMGKMMFDSLKESGQDGENGVTEEEKGSMMFHLKVGERCFCEECCNSILYSIMGEHMETCELPTLPTAKFEAVYQKISSLSLEELKDRSALIAEGKAKKIAAANDAAQKELEEWKKSLK